MLGSGRCIGLVLFTVHHKYPPRKKKKKRHKKGEKSGYSIIQFSHMVLSPVNNCTTDAAVTSTTAMSKSFQQKPSRSGPPS